ncbi:hypothetical protein AC1031_006896 [Aphanomyces cochlioides]|nr:hypothetical protein AC1031_006896 [Aphanomyces cochlioides]
MKPVQPQHHLCIFLLVIHSLLPRIKPHIWTRHQDHHKTTTAIVVQLNPSPLSRTIQPSTRASTDCPCMNVFLNFINLVYGSPSSSDFFAGKFCFTAASSVGTLTPTISATTFLSYSSNEPLGDLCLPYSKEYKAGLAALVV